MHKMTTTLRWTLTLVLLASGTVCGATIEETEKQLNEAYNKHRTITAELTLVGTLDVGGGMLARMDGSGRYELLRRDGKELIRCEVSSATTVGQGDAAQKTTSFSLSVADGVVCSTLVDQVGRKTVVRGPLDMAQKIGGEESFSSLHRDHDLTVLPDEVVQGKPRCVIEAKLRDPANPDPRRKRLFYFDRELGVMVQLKSLAENGTPIDAMTITSIKTDVDVDPSRFVFVTPPDVFVVDEHGTVISTPAPSATPAPSGSPAPAPKEPSPHP
jgi:hypothetical protein